MKQMDLSDYTVVELDYEDEDMPPSVRELRPAMYIDDGMYCCLLGPSPAEGILGSGSTPEAALADWESNLRERISEVGANDPVAQHAKDVLSARKKDVW